MRRAWLLAVALAGCDVPEFRYPPAAPRVERLEVLPVVAIPGETVTVRYRIAGATSARLLGLADSPRPIDPAEGAVELVADESRTLTLEADGEGGTTRAATGFIVDARAQVQVLAFDARPRAVHPGGAVRIIWRVEHARLVTVTANGLDLLYQGDRSDGFVVYHPGDGPQALIELRADGDGGPDTASVLLDVVPRVPLIYDFHASPVTVVGGQMFRLRWAVSGADSVRIYEELPGGDVELDPSLIQDTIDDLETSASVGAHSYRLLAVSGAGTATERTSVVVLPPAAAEIIGFTATPTVVGFGGESRLAWRTRNASQVALTDVAFNLPGTGSLLAPLNGSQTFQLEAYDFFSTPQLAQASVAVSPMLPSLVADLSPRTAAIGDEVLFTASTGVGATLSLFIDGRPVVTASTAPIWYSTPASGSVTYHVIAESPGGRTERHFSLLAQERPQILDFQVAPTIVRAGRPIRFAWATQDVGRLQLYLGFQYELSPVDNGFGFYAPSTGIFEARLHAENLIGDVDRTIGLDVRFPAQSNFEEEPNDSDATANGPYTQVPYDVTGALEPSDVDQYVWSLSYAARPVATTSPGSSCPGSIEIAVLEDRPDGPIDRGVRIGGPGLGCPNINAFETPALAELEPPLLLVLQQSAGASFSQPYILHMDVEERLCGDAILDPLEDCDDGNFTDGDGCSAFCYEEGADPEPNSLGPVTFPDGSVLTGYIASDDLDFYLLSVSPLEAGPHVLSLQPAFGTLDLQASVFDLATSQYYLGVQDSSGGVTIGPPALVLEAGDYQIVVQSGPGRILPRRGHYTLSIAPGG